MHRYQIGVNASFGRSISTGLCQPLFNMASGRTLGGESPCSSPPLAIAGRGIKALAVVLDLLGVCVILIC